MTEAFNIFRRSKGKAATSDKAKATMTMLNTGKDWTLHITGKGVPSIGYHIGKNWVLHIDDKGIPTIVGKGKA